MMLVTLNEALQSSDKPFTLESITLDTRNDTYYTLGNDSSGKSRGSSTPRDHNFDGATVDLVHQTSTGAAFAEFSGTFDSVSSVEIVEEHGNYFSIDDMKVLFPGTGTPAVAGDSIQVPVGTDIAALVASAASDNHGGTLLTYKGGTVDLTGIADPHSVQASWFHA